MESVPIGADLPAESPKFGFDHYAQALTRAILDGQPARFTVGIFGQWGSGKSTLLGAIRRQLEEEARERVICVSFDAWRYQNAESMLVPLLFHIAEAVEQAQRPERIRQMGRKLRNLLPRLNLNVLGLMDLQLGGEGKSGGVSADETFVRAMAELRDITKDLPAGEGRIVVLVDDLDRCSSDKIINVIESMRLTMDVEGIVFVLAVDDQRLVRAIQDRSPGTDAEGHAFLEKIIQVPFQIPRIDLPRGDFLADLMPGLDQDALPPGFSEVAHDIATLALRSNPRQIKRFVNTFLLRMRMHPGAAEEWGTLAAVVGLQIGWPEKYDKFVEFTLSEKKEFIGASLTNVEPPDRLPEYTARFLEGIAPERGKEFLTQGRAVARLEKATAATPPGARFDHEIRVTLEWALAEPAQDFDLDSAAWLLGGDGKIALENGENVVYYGNVGSPDGAVRHLGDRTVLGLAEGSESIHVDLPRAAREIREIVLAIAVYQAAERSQNLGLLERVTLRVRHGRTGDDLYSHDITEALLKPSLSAGLELGCLRRDDEQSGAWRFEARQEFYADGFVGMGRRYGVEFL